MKSEFVKLSLFPSNRFPFGDNVRLNQWLLNVRRRNWSPSKSSRLCSTHFKEDQFFIDNEVDGYIVAH